MNTNFVYKIFHLDNSTDRQKYVDDLNSYLEPKFAKLETPTISISSQEEVTTFLTEHPEFKLNGAGFIDQSGDVGWLYGEVGIWASNYLAWTNFLDTDAEYLILIEDDLVFTTRFLDILDIYLSQLPEDWDMFTAITPPIEFHKYNETYDVGAESICRAYQDWSLAFYIINRRSAQKLINSVHEEVVYPPDWHFYKQPEKFNVYAPKPIDAGFCHLSGAESTYQLQDTRRPIEGNV